MRCVSQQYKGGDGGVQCELADGSTSSLSLGPQAVPVMSAVAAKIVYKFGQWDTFSPIVWGGIHLANIGVMNDAVLF